MVYLLKGLRQSLPLSTIDENGKRSNYVLKKNEEIIVDSLSNQVKNLERINLIRIKELNSQKNRFVKKIKLF